MEYKVERVVGREIEKNPEGRKTDMQDGKEIEGFLDSPEPPIGYRLMGVPCANYVHGIFQLF